MDGNAIAVIGGLAGLVMLAVLLGSTIWLAWWMLEPINRAGGALNAPTRFMLIDFLALMILLQVGLAICGQALDAQGTSDSASRMYWALLAVVAVLALVLWLASVSVVSRAGILRPLRRMVVSVVLVPGALATIMGAPVLVVMLVGAIFGLFRREPTDDWLERQIPWLALAILGVGAVVVAMRRLSFWSLAGSTYGKALEGANPRPQG